MVVVAQLVRALVCGAEGRGFEPHHPPEKQNPAFLLEAGFLFTGSFMICLSSLGFGL